MKQVTELTKKPKKEIDTRPPMPPEIQEQFLKLAKETEEMLDFLLSSVTLAK